MPLVDVVVDSTRIAGVDKCLQRRIREVLLRLDAAEFAGQFAQLRRLHDSSAVIQILESLGHVANVKLGQDVRLHDVFRLAPQFGR